MRSKPVQQNYQHFLKKLKQKQKQKKSRAQIKAVFNMAF